MTPNFHFFAVALLATAPAMAQVEQFNVAQCAQLQLALEQNRDLQRRGYRLKQELKIKGQQAQLELQLHYHCQQPTEKTPPSARQQARRQSARRPPSAHRLAAAKTPAAPGLQISEIQVKAPYQGAKLTAWLQFYQPPFYCYGVRQTARIRQCVEQRQQAQQQFEQQYVESVTGRQRP